MGETLMLQRIVASLALAAAVACACAASAMADIVNAGSVQARRDFGNSNFGTFLVVN